MKSIVKVAVAAVITIASTSAAAEKFINSKKPEVVKAVCTLMGTVAKNATIGKNNGLTIAQNKVRMEAALLQAGVAQMSPATLGAAMSVVEKVYASRNTSSQQAESEEVVACYRARS